MDMTKKKCLECGLINFSTDMECRRCGNFIRRPVVDTATGGDKPGPLMGILGLIVVLLVGGGIWIWFSRASSSDSSSAPVVNPANVSQTKAAAVATPTPAFGNVDPHNDREVEKLLVPIDKARVDQFEEQKRKTVEDLGKKVQHPFMKGSPQ